MGTSPLISLLCLLTLSPCTRTQPTTTAPSHCDAKACSTHSIGWQCSSSDTAAASAAAGRNCEASSEFCQSGREITPIEVKMSSLLTGHPPPNDDLRGEKCVDGDTKTLCHTAPGSGSHPWVALVIPHSTVSRVRITNRVHVYSPLVERTKNMKVWVGKQLPSTASAEYSRGELLGEFKGPGTTGQVVDIGTGKGLVGSVVVVQMQTDQINLAEIEVFGETAPNPDTCKDGWTRHQNKCYFFSQRTVSQDWATAEAECNKMYRGSHLISIGSKEEQDFIDSNAADYQSWLGGTDAESEGQWTWTDGRPWGFTNWATNEPDGGVKANCIYMYSSRANRKWDDYYCDYRLSSHLVCSYDLDHCYCCPPQQTPTVESTTLTVESTTPTVESTTLTVESTTPTVESTTPTMDSTTPTVESTTPTAEPPIPCEDTGCAAQLTTKDFVAECINIRDGKLSEIGHSHDLTTPWQAGLCGEESENSCCRCMKRPTGCLDIDNACKDAFQGAGVCLNIKTGNLSLIDVDIPKVEGLCNSKYDTCCGCYRTINPPTSLSVPSLKRNKRSAKNRTRNKIQNVR